MNTLTCKVALLALALGGAITTLTLCQAAERGWSFTYNTQGQLESSDGPRTDVSDITRYAYDAKGHLARIINALGHTTTFSNFDAAGSPKTVVDSNGVITNLTYAPQGWVRSLSTATGTVRLEHNAVGDIIKIIRADNSWSTYTWDDARRLIRVTNNAGEQIEFDLDPMGNRTAVRIKDKTGKLTKQHQWVYDELGRLLRSVGAAGQTSQTQYDLNDNPIALTNPRNHSHQRAFDSLNRWVTHTDPLNGITQLEYDVQDNLTHVRDPRGVTTQYQYDGLGNLTRLNSPDSGATDYQYDAAGNVTQQVDARGVVTTFTYDALNRLTARRYPTNPALDVQFHYDSIAAGNKGIGRLTAVEDVNGVLNYTYDAQGNVTTQRQTAPANTATQPEQIGYGYDVANRLSRIDYPTGFSIVYSRNTTGQISHVQVRRGTGQPTAFASNITYQPFGPLKSLTWANGTTLQRTYDLDYRLTAQTVAGQSKTYTYDAHGNITQMQRSSLGNLDYSYDALDRLTEETTPSQRQTYVYDAAGNRTHKALDFLVDGEVYATANTFYQYGASSNRSMQIGLHSVDTDAAGNLIEERTNGASRQFSYDEHNRLSNVKIDGVIKAQFRYNAFGQRTQKITPQRTTTFVYGLSGELIGETLFDNQGKKLTSQFYIWLEGMPLGGISVTYSANGAPANSTVFYLHSDHLNTPRSATNAAREKIWGWDSPAFGTSEASGPLTINLRFPGQYYDVETGSHYNYFRDYDPETGRYVQSDPIGLNGGLNTYGYVGGNPISKFDFWGLAATFPGVGGMNGVQLGQYAQAQAAINSPAVLAALLRPTSDPIIYVWGAAGAVGDFGRNYNDMRDANTIGADKYFHCKANCEAGQRGQGGSNMACFISNAREWTDQNIKGDPATASAADQIANKHGRTRGLYNPAQSCGALCSLFRPGGLEDRY